MQGSLLSLMFCAGLLGQAGERKDSMPAFEADVIGVRTFAHAGPGIEFYPTQLLPRGEKVTVYGVKNGWAAIGPPKGSFSWIPYESVLEEDDGTARVTTDEVKLRVGSMLSDGHHIFQVTLNKGDRVMILDRQPLRHGNRVSEWFKVRPHRDELRYVAADNLDLPTPLAVQSAAANAVAGSNAKPANGGPPAGGFVNPPLTGIPPATPAGAGSVLAPTSTTQAFDPAIRPANGRMIPAAQPLNRLGGLRNAEAEPSGDPSAPPLALIDEKMAPIDKRIQSLRNQLELMRAREPSKWNLDSADRILADLRNSARTDADKSAVAETQALVRKLEETQDRYAKTIKRFDAALARDQELAGRQVARQADLGRLNRRFAAEGTMRRPALRVGEQQTMAIENAAGQVTHYAVAQPGLDLDKYVGKKVGLLGPAARRPNIPVPVIEVEQVMMLDPQS